MNVVVEICVNGNVYSSITLKNQNLIFLVLIVNKKIISCLLLIIFIVVLINKVIILFEKNQVIA